MDNLDKETLTNRAKIQLVRAKMNYMVECFGDELAKQEGYKDLDGIEAIHYYLVLKHSWLPGQVKDLSLDVIRELLNVELQSFSLSREQIDAMNAACKEELVRL